MLETNYVYVMYDVYVICDVYVGKHTFSSIIDGMVNLHVFGGNEGGLLTFYMNNF